MAGDPVCGICGSMAPHFHSPADPRISGSVLPCSECARLRAENEALKQRADSYEKMLASRECPWCDDGEAARENEALRKRLEAAEEMADKMEEAMGRAAEDLVDAGRAWRQRG